MDPVTAMIVMTAISGAIGLSASASQKREQKKMQQEQERLRIESVRSEIGAQQQVTSTALGSASRRPGQGTSNSINTMQPSFASAALTGNQSSNTPMAAGGSSGTF